MDGATPNTAYHTAKSSAKNGKQSRTKEGAKKEMVAQHFYNRFFRCTRGGHWLPQYDAVEDKGGRLVCPIHGKLVRSKPVVKGMKK
jgi:hypothetical protein